MLTWESSSYFLFSLQSLWMHNFDDILLCQATQGYSVISVSFFFSYNIESYKPISGTW